MKKIFYFTEKLGDNEYYWSTESFDDDELKIIEKFLKEFNDKLEETSILGISDVMIIEDDEEEESE